MSCAKWDCRGANMKPGIYETKLRHELYEYASHLTTQLQILEMEYSGRYFNGRLSEWLREYKPTLTAIRALMRFLNDHDESIAQTEPFNRLWGLIAAICGKQGQQKSLKNLRILGEQTCDAMRESGW